MIPIAMAMQVGGGLMSAFGKRKAGKRAKKIAQENARILEANAEGHAAETRENFRREQQNIEAQMSAIRARFANQGSLSNVGAPLAVMGEITGKLELGILDNYRASEAKRSAMYQEASNLRRAGKQAYKDGKNAMFGSLLGTANDAFTNYKTAGQVMPKSKFSIF